MRVTKLREKRDNYLGLFEDSSHFGSRYGLNLSWLSHLYAFFDLVFPFNSNGDSA
jgi:hypothetical protein